MSNNYKNHSRNGQGGINTIYQVPFAFQITNNKNLYENIQSMNAIIKAKKEEVPSEHELSELSGAINIARRQMNNETNREYTLLMKSLFDSKKHSSINTALTLSGNEHIAILTDGGTLVKVLGVEQIIYIAFDKDETIVRLNNDLKVGHNYRKNQRGERNDRGKKREKNERLQKLVESLDPTPGEAYPINEKEALQQKLNDFIANSKEITEDKNVEIEKVAMSPGQDIATKKEIISSANGKKDWSDCPTPPETENS